MHSLLPSLSLCLALSLSACSKDNPPNRGAPPPIASSNSEKRCSDGGGTVQDQALSPSFPRSINNFCVDPNGETRTFGEGSPKELDKICTEAFDGDCEIYKSFGLKRVSLFRYIDGTGSPASIDVVVSRFATTEGAYGMFTKRVISDADPARQDAPKELRLPGAAALGTGSAYLFRGQLVVELTYTNEQESPAQLTNSSEKALRALAELVAPKLPGAPDLPVSATRLPSDQRIPLGIFLEPTDAFSVTGSGPGAYGYYKDGEKRFRILSITRTDPEQANDLISTIGKRPATTKEKEFADGGYRLMIGDGKDGPRIEWIVARRGTQIFGIGDESSVLTTDLSSAQREKICLSRNDKLKKLKALLAASK